MFRELNEENGSGVVAGEGSGLSEQSTRIERGDKITDTLPLHTHIRCQYIVPHLCRGQRSEFRGEMSACL